MIRRRRRTREIPFSFDSFLDVVANVVGIIIRLILVVWVGSRSYSSLTAVPRPAAQAEVDNVAPQRPEDPLKAELARHRQELARAQQQLLEQLHALELTQAQEGEATEGLTAVTACRQELDRQQAALDGALGERQNGASGVH